MPPPFSMGGGHIVSLLSVHMSVPSVHPVRRLSRTLNTNDFHAISFEKIGVLD